MMRAVKNAKDSKKRIGQPRTKFLCLKKKHTEEMFGKDGIYIPPCCAPCLFCKRRIQYKMLIEHFHLSHKKRFEARLKQLFRQIKITDYSL